MFSEVIHKNNVLQMGENRRFFRRYNFLFCSMRKLLLLLCFIGLGSALQAQNDTNAVLELHKKIRVFQLNDEIDSIAFYEAKAMAISEKINYEFGITHALTTFGLIYRIKGDYSKALNNFFKALAIYEKKKDKMHVLVQISNIAAVYYFQNDNAKAKKYYLEAIALSREIGDKRIESDNLCNLAAIYNDEGDYANSEKCLNGALEIDRAMDNKVGIIHALADLGNLSVSMGDYERALAFAKEALELSWKSDYDNVIPTCYKILGTASFHLKKNQDAENYYFKALGAAMKLHDMNDKMQIEGSISDFYEATGKPDKVLIHYKNYIAYRDSMYNEENTRKTVETEMNYEFDKKQAAIKYENDKLVYQLEADNQLHKQWRLFFIVAIGLTLVVLFFVKRAYDNKKKLAALLAAEDQRKDVLLQEVHHRINNNLQIISSLLTLQANNADNEKLTEYLVQSQNRIQSLSAMHELLYDTNSPLEINMKDYLHKVLDFHRDVAGSMPIPVSIEEEVESVFFPTKLAVPLALIINELVTNSLKYAFAGKEHGIVKVTLRENPQEMNWQVTVSDNGKGLPAEGAGRKDSLGLKLVNIMTRQIKGTFQAKNDHGAFFNLIFNLLKKRER
jgi:two-component sensor histidine kinase